MLFLAGCAHPPPPSPVMAPVVPDTSPLALRNEWQKGYEAGLYEGKREQARRDRVLLVPTTLPPPPPPGTQAVADGPAPPPAPAPAPAAIPPLVQTPPQSVFVPAGPAEPVNRNP
jgi:hypothetical protein